MDQAQLDRCLTDAEFAKLHSGDLSPEEETPLQDHLGACSKCWSRYEQMLGDDPLFRGLKDAWNDRASMVRFGAGTRTDTGSDVRAPGAGLHIEGYQIIRELGRGGMGVVYEAVQARLNRRVALKVLPTGTGSVTRDAVSRFKREATAAAKLHHTNIVPVYDFGESGHTYYYAMELIEGEPLTRIIRRLASGEDPTIMQAHSLAAPMHSQVTQHTLLGHHSARGHYRQIARWLADAADALHYAHGQGIIHRDIKPGNLIMSNDGRVMILDFGLAKSVDDISMTRTGTMIGTLRYMSPEQVMAKEQKLDHRTDVYSLGATLYELLTFQPAFKGRDQKELLSQILNREPTPPRKILPEIPRELNTICLKTLEKDPNARYATAKALAQDLRRFTQDLPIVARPAGPVGRTVKFVRRRPWLSLASAVSLLLVISVILAVTFSRRARAQKIEALYQEANRFMNIQNRQYEAGIRVLNNLLAIDPDNAPALYNLANAKRELFNQIGDERLFTQAIGDAQHAIDVLQAKTDPSSANDVLPPSRETRRSLLIRTLNLQGILHKKLNNYDEAVNTYRRGIEIEPGVSFLWENLAVIFALQGKLTDAEATLRKAAKLAGDNPDLVGAWRNLGAVQLELGLPDCRQSLRQATRILQEDSGAWLLLARMYLSLEAHRDYERARDHARDADTRMKGKDPRIKRVYALAELRRARYEDAVEQAEESLALRGSPAFNHLILAVARARLGEIDAARSSYQQALKNWPADLERAGVIASHDGSLLWFEHYDELLALRRDAEQLLGTPSP